MPLYQSRRFVIEAVRFDPELHIPGVMVKQSISGVWHVWNAQQQAYLPIIPGAYLVIGDKNDVYPIEGRKFEARYVLVTEAGAETEPAQQGPDDSTNAKPHRPTLAEQRVNMDARTATRRRRGK
jgi:hypothetical protein